jgi:DNA-binding response OmpR family regulator
MNDKLRILMVEDNEALLILYDHAFPEEVFEKEFADNGSRALEIYRQWHPDIILLDIMLPEMSGHQILEEIREVEDDSSTSVIIATSLDLREDMERCENLGIHGYIVKPFNHKELPLEVLNMYRESNSEKAEWALARLAGISKA